MRDLVQVTCDSNSRLFIGNQCNIKDTTIRLSNKANIELNDFFVAQNDSEVICDNSSVTIGKYSTAGRRFYLVAGNNAVVHIGSDCMIASDVSIIGSNTHSIIDLEKKRIVPDEKKKVQIGNHVWLAKNAACLPNTVIGDGSIVGAFSVARGNYPKNCIIAGNIAEVKATNRTWDRRDGLQDDDL